MGYRITFQAIGATLHDDEFRFGGGKILLDLYPDTMKIGVVRAGRERNIEFASACLALSSLFSRSGTRIQIATVFMDIRKYQVGIFLKTVENAVAVVSVNIDLGDTFDSELPTQVFNRDSSII